MGFLVFIVTFNTISVILCRSVLLVEYPEKTTDMAQVTDKLYHIMMCRKHLTRGSVLIIYTIKRLTLSISDDGHSKHASWARVSYKKQKSLTLREHLDLPPVFGGVRVAHLFSFLCCVCRFVCLRSNVASVSWLSIIARSVFSHVYLVKLRKMYLM
jgi:hypothetical protein